MKRKRTLYVKRVSYSQISRHWGKKAAALIPYGLFGGFLYFIQCTKAGKINWDKNSIYDVKELIERNNVKIIN